MKDVKANRFGEFHGVASGWYFLRPIGGGLEWHADPADVRQATYAETKRARAQATANKTRAAGSCAKGEM